MRIRGGRARAATLAVLVALATGCVAGLPLARIRGNLRLGEKTPLMDASEAGKLADVQQLLAKGASVDARTAHGWTALHFAARGGYADVAAALLDAGANVNALTDYLQMPLHMALASDADPAALRKTVAVLVQHGASLDFSDGYGRAPLEQAALTGKYWALGDLIRAGAKIPEVASSNPIDVEATGWCEMAAGDVAAAGGETGKARQDYTTAAAALDQAATGYGEAAKETRSKLHWKEAERVLATVVWVSAVAAVNAGAYYQAQFQATQVAQVAALQSAASGGSGVGYGSVVYQQYWGPIPNFYGKDIANLKALAKTLDKRGNAVAEAAQKARAHAQ